MKKRNFNADKHKNIFFNKNILTLPVLSNVLLTTIKARYQVYIPLTPRLHILAEYLDNTDDIWFIQIKYLMLINVQNYVLRYNPIFFDKICQDKTDLICTIFYFVLR